MLVERLIVPAACSPVTDPYYAMTFQHPITGRTGTGAAGTTARWPEITVVGGQPVDMVGTVVSGGLTTASFGISGDDAIWPLSSGGTTNIRLNFYRSGTTTPVNMNAVFTFGDLDTRESNIWTLSDLAGYMITPGSKVKVSMFTPTAIRFDGTIVATDLVTQRYQIWVQNRSQIMGTFGGDPGSATSLDGDVDSSLPPSCEDYGDAPDSYKTLLASDGPRHALNLQLRLGAELEFDGDGQPTQPEPTATTPTAPTTRTASPPPITQSAGQATTVAGLGDQQHRDRGHAGRLDRPQQERHVRHRRAGDRGGAGEQRHGDVPAHLPGLVHQRRHLRAVPALPRHPGRPAAHRRRDRG